MTDIATIPTRYKPPPHLFGDHVYLPEQTERTCKQCGVTKITSKDGKRLWRLAGNLVAGAGEAPVCVPVGEKAAT